MPGLTCFSCQHYRIHGCAEDGIGWPRLHIDQCHVPGAGYEPGSDEAEYLASQQEDTGE